MLIVDDHAPFREAARALLSSGGYEVVGEAADVWTAVVAAREVSPDLVLVDVHLPGVDGFDVTRRLLSEHPGLCVVLTSSRDATSIAPRLPDSGAVGFLSKVDLSAVTLTALVSQGVA